MFLGAGASTLAVDRCVSDERPAGAPLVTKASPDEKTGRREGGKGSSSLSRETPEPELEDGDVEVDEECCVDPRELEVRDHLGFVDGQKALHGLELDEDLVLDDEVHTVSAVEAQAFVVDRKRALSLEAKLAQRQLAAEARFVGRLE